MDGPVGRMGPGEVLAGRYTLLSLLGQGGMSRVFLVEDRKLPGKRWAVKETYVGRESDLEYAGGGEKRLEAERRMRLLRSEAETMSRLSHPNLPDIIDYVPPGADGFSYLVMDYIEGETLQERFERQGQRMTGEQVAEWALQLCGLLDYLHSLQPEPVIHRDLKPVNLMVGPDGRLRLIDFGTARSFKAGLHGDTVSIGTIGFAAPEQFAGRQSDTRTDLYGLGALMYYLLSGGEHYRPSANSRPALPEGLGEIVLRLLRENPDERFQSAREAALALRGWRVAGAAPEQRAPGQAPERPPLVIAVGALYRGAGATFAALTLARLLQDRGIPHAVVEPPTSSAELYALLFAEKNAPPGYRCYNNPTYEGTPQWSEGPTLWLPAAPGWSEDGGGSVMNTAAWSRLFREAARPVIVADIGAEWEHPAAQELLERAADIVYTVDPMLHKLELPAVKSRLRRIRGWAAAGKTVHGIANRCVRSKQTGDWLGLLPDKPACLLPALESAWVAEACWSGRLPQDIPVVRRALHKAAGPWLDRVLATAGMTAAERNESKRRGIGIR